MYKLIKASSPGWEKDFATQEEALAELKQHVCKGCMEGEDMVVGEGGELERYTRPAPDPNDIGAVLSTPCGCEFWYEPTANDPEQRAST